MLYISVLRNERLWEADYESTSAYRNIVLGILYHKVENYIKETMLASGLQILISLFAHWAATDMTQEEVDRFLDGKLNLKIATIDVNGRS